MATKHTRNQTAILTGFAEGYMRNLGTKDLLVTLSAMSPEVAEAAESGDPSYEIRGWNRWTAAEVVAIAVQHRFMCQIGLADGLRPETALKLAGAAGGVIARIAAGYRGRDLWAGYIGQPVEVGGADGGFHVEGILPEVALRIEAASADLAPGESEPLRVFLVNVSAVVREVEAAAKKAGIAFDLKVDE